MRKLEFGIRALKYSYLTLSLSLLTPTLLPYKQTEPIVFYSGRNLSLFLTHSGKFDAHRHLPLFDIAT
jgi:hypothetical protein